ncbi:hypothetical protein CHS0354_007177 [Potamilus streckersoni]|uniref:CUB domain-containing protein n=1 Tax=Potamilus streckersoni TaxID=2493646 RepID=A0AAE0W888_9BIVA|nr:hypothetical protein CHS0354_007177 [Potamilus streckersoni]
MPFPVVPPLFVFPVSPPLRPFGLTAVQDLFGITVLLMILQTTIDVINRRTKKITCGQPPSTLGDLVLYKQQGNAAFYDTPGLNVYFDVPLTCPIIYCQANGTFSTPEFSTNQSVFFPVDEKRLVIDTSGAITTPNYPASYNLSNGDAIWSIMTPGTNIVFRIEDFNIDSNSYVQLLCGDKYVLACIKVTCNFALEFIKLVSKLRIY